MTQEVGVSSVVKKFILDEFLPGEDPDNLTPLTPLMSSGILDSIATLKLITFLEQEFNIQFEAHEVDQHNFDTLQAISDFVNSKSR
jgi:acyl carrier protein